MRRAMHEVKALRCYYFGAENPYSFGFNVQQPENFRGCRREIWSEKMALR